MKYTTTATLARYSFQVGPSQAPSNEGKKQFFLQWRSQCGQSGTSTVWLWRGADLEPMLRQWAKMGWTYTVDEMR